MDNRILRTYQSRKVTLTYVYLEATLTEDVTIIDVDDFCIQFKNADNEPYAIPITAIKHICVKKTY